MARRTARRRGITLAELLITATILGIVAPAILIASGTAARMGRGAQKRAAARAIAVRYLETFRTLCRNSAVSAGTTNTTEDVPKIGTFTIKRVITKSGTLYACDMTLTWNDASGNGVRTETLELGTMMREGS